MANRWDNSSILLSNQSGALLGQGISEAGRAFGKGVNAYFERKKQQEKEDATVEWLDQNTEAVNQLFPQLAKVADPAERRKVIKAGIKGAGLENMVQVRQFMDNQARQKQQDEINNELTRANTTAVTLRNDEARQMMADAAAINAKADQQLVFAGAGAPVRDEVRAAAKQFAASPLGQMRSAGVRITPEIAAELTRDQIRYGYRNQQFNPREMMTPSGINMVQTSPSSWIPDPRLRQKPPADRSGEYERIVTQLESSGAFDKKPENLTPKEKALFDRMKALNTKGTDPEAMAAAIVGAPGGGSKTGDAKPDAAAAPAGPVKISTKAERDALPAGTPYIAPDGKTYLKK